jgi:hypothetical protein
VTGFVQQGLRVAADGDPIRDLHGQASRHSVPIDVNEEREGLHPNKRNLRNIRSIFDPRWAMVLLDRPVTKSPLLQ